MQVEALILWDVDKTLVDVAGVSRDAADRVVVIGDTPLDIEAAHGAGARAVAVAPGASTAGDLATAGADEVLEDLTSSDALVAAVYDRLLGLG